MFYMTRVWMTAAELVAATDAEAMVASPTG
jgi:hypothetical protein